MRTIEKAALPFETIRSQVSHACFFSYSGICPQHLGSFVPCWETGTRLLWKNLATAFSNELLNWGFKGAASADWMPSQSSVRSCRRHVYANVRRKRAIIAGQPRCCCDMSVMEICGGVGKLSFQGMSDRYQPLARKFQCTSLRRLSWRPISFACYVRRKSTPFFPATMPDYLPGERSYPETPSPRHWYPRSQHCQGNQLRPTTSAMATFTHILLPAKPGWATVQTGSWFCGPGPLQPGSGARCGSRRR